MSRLIDISGQIFNGILVIKRSGRDSTKKVTWLCQCHCGNEFVTTGLNLKSGNTKSCGCSPSKKSRKDLSGKVFGRLTVLGYEKTVKGVASWLCQCLCGNKTTVITGKLQSKHTRSCGCLQSEISSELAINNLAGKKRDEHPRWDFSLTDLDRQKRRGSANKDWSKSILERDGFTCQNCGKTGKLNAHHIWGYREFTERRLDLSNGIALCESCHTDFHKTFGYKHFTRENLFDFLGVDDPGDWMPIGEINNENLGNALKYIWRCDLKQDAIEDLKKAKWYIERELERRGSQIAKKPIVEWPDEMRIEAIGQNGNNGEHYEDEAFKSLEGSSNG